MEQVDLNRSIVTISKEALSKLPAEEYKGKIHLIDSEAGLSEAFLHLNKAPIIGFDTETRPSFKKGTSYNVALVQLATPEESYLFRTNIIGFPKELIDILENESLLKVGLSIHDDFHNLNKINKVNNFHPKGFIDLQSFVKEYKIADNSLSRLYGILFGKRISKAQRLTNWEAKELTDLQLRYAALDAYACIKIYDYLKNGNFDPMKSEYLTIPEEEVTKENPEE